MKESKIERKLVNEIKKRGGLALKFTPAGQRGYADRVLLLPGGRSVFVELKAKDEKMKKLQAKRAAELEALGFRVYRNVDSYEKINFVIKEMYGE